MPAATVPTHIHTRAYHPQTPALPTVPGYTVLCELARGGMGAVFAAHDPTFGREVAIKVMHLDQDPGRFVTESKVTAQLPHPGVPPVYALGTLPDGRPFLAMKLIAGRTLADELKRAKHSDLPRLLGAFESICQTVGFAHARGTVHRDLKPANIMVGSFGEVLVMDADPNLAGSHALLGDLLQMTGDLPGARIALTEAARLDPKRFGPKLAKLPPVAPPPRAVNR